MEKVRSAHSFTRIYYDFFGPSLSPYPSKSGLRKEKNEITSH